MIGDLGASALRVLVGFAVAYLLAVPVGIAMGLHRGLARALSGILALLRPLSPPAWIPLAILWFGIGDAPAIFIIFVGTFAALLLGAGSATQHLDEQWLDAAATLGASRVQVLLTVVLPGLLPSLLSLARMGLGLAWMCVIAAEMVAVRRGVGFMMSEARNLFRTDDVMVGMIAIGLIGLGTDALVGRIERTFCRWRGDVGPTLSKGQGPVS